MFSVIFDRFNISLGNKVHLESPLFVSQYQYGDWYIVCHYLKLNNFVIILTRTFLEDNNQCILF